MENGLNFIPKMQGEGKFNIYRKFILVISQN